MDSLREIGGREIKGETERKRERKRERESDVDRLRNIIREK